MQPALNWKNKQKYFYDIWKEEFHNNLDKNIHLRLDALLS